jgi:sodium-dependent dicarboxylate transporter 2/3/5
MAHWVGLVAGPLAALVMYFALQSEVSHVSPLPKGALGQAGLLTLCIGAWMAIWWVTEPVSSAVTAMLPLALFPILGVLTFKQAAPPYADELIVLFFAGFVLGAAVERWGLHKRLALLTVMAFGTRPSMIVLGVMCATALVSMWVSNTATAVMMMPIALSLASMVDRPSAGAPRWPARSSRNFTTSLVLAVAYGASIGGIGTPIGTPPNIQLTAYAKDVLGREIGFGQWMLVAAPIVLISLPLVWALLIRMHPMDGARLPAERGVIRAEFRKLGPPSRGEAAVLVVFILAATAWIARTPMTGWLNEQARQSHSAAMEIWKNAGGAAADQPAALVKREYITDAGIGLLAALALFCVPIRAKKDAFMLEWKHCADLPWGTLMLFGGGLSLAAAMKSTGLESYLGSMFEALRGLPPLVFLLVLAAAIVALSEIASNTALAAAMIPILGAGAKGLGMDPIALLFVATLAASCGFALPVATPPNAIAYGTGRISLRHMIRSGVGVDVVCVLVVVGTFWLLGDTLLGWAGLAGPGAAP